MPQTTKTNLNVSSLAVSLLLFCCTVSAQEATGYTELPRFQQVSEKLFRGGQPRETGIGKLRELGITTVINLRGASDRTRAEDSEVRALGLNYFNAAANRVRHVVQSAFNGRRIVLFSGGPKESDEALFAEARAIRDGGGFGSIIGRNSFQRDKAAALRLLDEMVRIYQK